mmetsp:Transcript_8362/g.15783  ORF Transcript_8362/g.15783 Transcript_8362/m.15783 type:complete len:105 (-) Transcript_8362:2210-2524(-)
MIVIIAKLGFQSTIVWFIPFIANLHFTKCRIAFIDYWWKRWRGSFGVSFSLSSGENTGRNKMTMFRVLEISCTVSIIVKVETMGFLDWPFGHSYHRFLLKITKP